ncbi:hypothetical protein Back11_16300 [Paenibacillus baekrokdamisoli]|uniref:Uncharacterized protein n=1 Tax=Paenibacillus baekrokdamisoli TaxID=1712516 RepID=A0A3G9IVW4_9BACL|nr:helix-turn-helix domain-containing protein [Paenibacillus baekrokdamisoli]MBB3071980.1 AraC-like DNA-binding protein [Paenibacillus baekrokdamisoli]BBH20285.1 hypothetical protein Back11_16300 [Paenibacillus baekrokdamisoli]
MIKRMMLNKTWLRRLLLSYVTVFLFIVPLLLFILLLGFGDMSRKTAVESNAIYAKQVLQSLDNQMQLIDNTITNEVATDETLFGFFNQALRDERYYSGYLPSLKVSRLMASMPLIDSIYLYRLSDDKVQTPYSVDTLDSFVDKQVIVEALKQPNLNHSWLNVRKGYTEQRQVADFLSLVRYVPLNSGNDGLIVVNVQVQSIIRFVHSLMPVESNHIRLNDRVGTPIYQGSGDEGLIMTELKSDYSGWTISSGLENGNAFRFVSTMSDYWLIVCLIFFIIGLLWIVVAARINYKPIQSIIQRFQMFSQQKSAELFRKGAQDDFKFIDSALDHLMEQFNAYHKQHEEDLIYKRKHFFFEWIEGNGPLKLEKWQQEMNSLGLPFEFASLCVSVIEISKYGRFTNSYTPQDQNLLKYILASVVKEMADTRNVTSWAEWTSNDQLTVVFHIPTALMEEKSESLIMDLSDKLCRWVGTNLDFDIAIGISSGIDLIELIHDAYNEALKALQYKPSLGQKSVIGYWQIPSVGKQQPLDLLQYIRAMAFSYRTGDSAWLDHFERLFEEMRLGLYTREELSNLMSYLIFFLQKELTELPSDLKTLWTGDALAKLQKSVDGWDSLDELQQELHLILAEFANVMKELRQNNSHYLLIRSIKEYLEEHYANPDLSLLHLSEEFHVHMKSISRLFKEEIGENFIDHLARIRIEHAKELLLRTDCSIQEITLKVGYLHPNTFIRSFKKLVGQTPGDYRKEIRVRQSG